MSLLKAKLKNRILRVRLRGRQLPPLAAANLRALDHLEPGAPALDYSYVVLDLETTGLDTASDRVVSVGAVRLRQGRVRLGERFGELVNPGRDIPPESIKVHGIKPDMIASARPAALVFDDFLAFLGGDLLVAHHAAFDLHFLNQTMRARYGFALQNLVLDTVPLCRALVLPSDPYGIQRRRQRCGLDALAERFGLPQAGRHSALGDARLTLALVKAMAAQFTDSA